MHWDAGASPSERAIESLSTVSSVSYSWKPTLAVTGTVIAEHPWKCRRSAAHAEPTQPVDISAGTFYTSYILCCISKDDLKKQFHA
jgi:hypothetical protein